MDRNPRNAALANTAVVIALLGIVGCGTNKGPAQDGDSGSLNGDSGPVVEFNHPLTWTPLDLGSDPGFLSSVWGSGPNDVFIVGGEDTAQIYHFDGATWSIMAPPAGSGLLIWVFGFSPTDVFAVGVDGTAIHYDGDTWSSLDSTTDQNLWGVWGTSRNDMWVVGGNVGDGDPVILHFDGTQFSNVGLAPSENPFGARALFKVYGVGGKTFAVGAGGLIVELQAGQWKRVPAGVNADEDFIALTGNAADNIVVCGGRSGSRIATYDGSVFTTARPTGLGGTSACFMTDLGTTFVGGLPGFVGHFDPSTGQVNNETNANYQIHALWGDNAGRVYAVGGLAGPPYPAVGLVGQ